MKEEDLFPDGPRYCPRCRGKNERPSLRASRLSLREEDLTSQALMVTLSCVLMKTSSKAKPRAAGVAVIERTG